jgi:hypothetical protein
MLTRRNVLKWVAGLFASLPFMKGMANNKVSETPDSDDGVAGFVICETSLRIEAKICKANTMNEFEQIGHKMMPEATRISVRFADSKYVLLDGPGFNWEVCNLKGIVV